MNMRSANERNTHMLLTILLWIVFGAIAGWIASAIAGANRRISGWMNVVVGILGAAIGGLIFRTFGSSGVTGFNLYSFLVAIAGAVVFLWLVNMFSPSHRIAHH